MFHKFAPSREWQIKNMFNCLLCWDLDIRTVEIFREGFPTQKNRPEFEFRVHILYYFLCSVKSNRRALSLLLLLLLTLSALDWKNKCRFFSTSRLIRVKVTFSKRSPTENVAEMKRKRDLQDLLGGPGLQPGLQSLLAIGPQMIRKLTWTIQPTVPEGPSGQSE